MHYPSSGMVRYISYSKGYKSKAFVLAFTRNFNLGYGWVSACFLLLFLHASGWLRLLAGGAVQGLANSEVSAGATGGRGDEVTCWFGTRRMNSSSNCCLWCFERSALGQLLLPYYLDRASANPTLRSVVSGLRTSSVRTPRGSGLIVSTLNDRPWEQTNFQKSIKFINSQGAFFFFCVFFFFALVKIKFTEFLSSI